MSSREIAKLTGKRHDNVRADIEKMARELSLSFQEKPEATAGRPILAYHLPKRETLILVSGYSIPLRARIIDRWMELEAEAQGREAKERAGEEKLKTERPQIWVRRW